MPTVPRIFPRRLRRKSVALFLFAFQTLFLNVIARGHTRGVITLTGTNSATSLADLGCPCCRLAQHDPKQAPDHDRQSECLICHLVAHLSLPPVMDHTPPPLCRAGLAAFPAPTSAPFLRIPLVLHDRAPPFVV